MESPWERIDVSSWDVASDETEGSEAKFWLEEPRTESHTRWLYKDIVIKNGNEQGEDWSEIIATQVAMLLHVPCARTRLASRNGHRGALSRDVAPPGFRHSEGRIVLKDKEVPGYYPGVDGGPGHDPEHPDVKRPGHTPENIRRALLNVDPPPGFNGPAELTAFDVFTGYLILDALIANRDRHEQNWAVLCPESGDGRELLSPSYDHASCLGFGEPDTKRSMYAHDPHAFRSWVERGTAHRFEHRGNKPPSLVVVAGRALGLCSDEGREHWSDRVASLSLAPLTDTVLRACREDEVALIPEMSEAAITFARMVLETNLRRLRDEFDACAATPRR
ncbi:MAG: hypothetical protein L0K74_00815 [Acidipropionibacterium acidipropionici]|nr:hypothetical protein [Acidipropionibacterium acidipropionici]